ncbi:histidine phosphatase family protein [Gluconobacter wancherniae]|uniref:SixA phosphatase family protein n=1 Tax=Gluconobacter wancherniae TaxID=1307955 RepID=UPI00309EDA16
MTERRLVLLRHAEAGPHLRSDAGDRARPLTEKGFQQATTVGRQLALLAPDTPMEILCSPALRTQQTAAAVLEILPAATDPVFEDLIYDATVDDLYGLIHAVSEDIQTVIVIGHNPTIGALAYELLGPAIHIPAFSNLRNGYTPASMTIFRTEALWHDIRPSTVQAELLITP